MHSPLPDRRRSRLGFRRMPRASFTCESFEPRQMLAAASVGIAFDTHYGEGGAAELPLGLDYGFDVAADASGRLLAAGHLDQFGQDLAAVVRLNRDGSRDASFDGDGLATLSTG